MQDIRVHRGRKGFARNYPQYRQRLFDTVLIAFQWKIGEPDYVLSDMPISFF